MPITSRTSCPRSRSAAAWSSACSTTAPQNDHEYGTTIPTFISHKYPRPATLYARMTLARLVPLALVALLAASCSGNDKKSSATTTGTTTTGATGSSSGSTGARPPASSSTGRLAVGKRDLNPLLVGSLARYVSKPVSATSATIVQVAGIDSFWAGRNEAHRVLVKIDLNGKRPPRLQNGQKVSFVGRFCEGSEKWRQPGREGQDGTAVAHEAGRLHHRPDRQAEAAVEPWAAGSCSGSAAC